MKTEAQQLMVKSLTSAVTMANIYKVLPLPGTILSTFLTTKSSTPSERKHDEEEKPPLCFSITLTLTTLLTPDVWVFHPQQFSDASRVPSSSVQF